MKEKRNYKGVTWDFCPFCEFLADLTIEIWRLEKQVLSLRLEKGHLRSVRAADCSKWQLICLFSFY